MELHNRRYEVRAFRKSADCVLLRGMVRDDKPHGLYLEDDTEPLTIHHMIVDIEISFPSMVIQSAQVVFESHPHTECTGIVNHYQGLVGLSIARGFTHKVRELFGGPRGCTHVTALLSAMAPVAIQCAWSMRIASAREDKSINIPREQMSSRTTRESFCHEPQYMSRVVRRRRHCCNFARRRRHRAAHPCDGALERTWSQP